MTSNNVSGRLSRNTMMRRVKSLVKSLASKAGVHVVLQRNNHDYTLAGLRAGSFGAVLDAGGSIGQFARRAVSNCPSVRALNLGLGEKVEAIQLNFHE